MRANMLKGLMIAGVLCCGLQAQTVGERKENQQERIGNGVESGQLTPGETARVEGREARINRETRRDRAANGGTLTPREKAKVNRQQNRTSRAIYKDKHNARVE